MGQDQVGGRGGWAGGGRAGGLADGPKGLAMGRGSLGCTGGRAGAPRLSPIATLVMETMEPSACKVPMTSKKPLSTWSFLSSHDLSWLQCTVAAGPADDGRSISSEPPRMCWRRAAWRGRARRWAHPLRQAAAEHYPRCGSRACQRRALAGLRTARSAGAGLRSEPAQERVGRSRWSRGARRRTARHARRGVRSRRPRLTLTLRAGEHAPRRPPSAFCWERSDGRAKGGR